ncbi:MAG: class I SAM-dependent rRNA methyltransferase [Pseudohongiellaceae bacterium]
MHTVQLKKGRDASLLRHHPWIFSGAIEKVSGNPASGDTVTVTSDTGTVLGMGGYSAISQIRVRMYTFSAAKIDRDFLAERVKAALRKRQSILGNPERSACRLIFGESDGLPGLVVDKYNDFLVCQYLFTGMERWKQELTGILAEQTGCRGIYERSDVGIRDREGLPPTERLLWGESPPPELVIQEYGMQLGVDVIAGQKTGFYLDQAENRRIAGSWCADRRVLNCFAYSGGFSVAALQQGAVEVTSVDSSAPALAMARANVKRNGFEDERHPLENGNVFHLLRDWQKTGRNFEVIILDPPKFAESKSQVMKAARAYKDLALQAVRLLVPGGVLISFSCSGSIDMNLFQKITSDALLDAHREGDVVQYLHQSPDHPVALTFPESQYLKGLVCRINN